MHGVPVQVDGVCMSDHSSTRISRAPSSSSRAVARHRADRHAGGRGHLRAAIAPLHRGHLRERSGSSAPCARSPARSREHGLQVLSLTIRNVADKQGYLEALGRPAPAQVKRDRIRGEAEADGAKAARYEPTAIEDCAAVRDRARRLQRRGLRASAERTSPTSSSGRHRQQVRAESEGRDRRAPEGDRVMSAEVERVSRARAEIIEPALAKAPRDHRRREDTARTPPRSAPRGRRDQAQGPRGGQAMAQGPELGR